MTTSESSATSSVKIYFRLLSYVRPYVGIFLLSILGFVIFASTQPMLAGILKYFVDGLSNPDAALFPNVQWPWLRDLHLVYAVPLLIIIQTVVSAAGTPDIAGAIGLGAAIDWLQAQDRSALAAHEAALLRDATARAEAFDGMRLIGTAPGKVAVMSFLLEGAHPHDVGQLLDQQGVAVRTGHHCTMPLMDCLGIPG